MQVNQTNIIVDCLRSLVQILREHFRLLFAGRYLAEEAGVSAIPASLFYSAENQPTDRVLARFTFCKQDATLSEAIRRLAAIAQRTAGEQS